MTGGANANNRRLRKLEETSNPEMAAAAARLEALMREIRLLEETKATNNGRRKTSIMEDLCNTEGNSCHPGHVMPQLNHVLSAVRSFDHAPQNIQIAPNRNKIHYGNISRERIKIKDGDMRSEPPPWLEPSAWDSVVDIWEEAGGAFQKASMSAKENRKKVKIIHSTGSISFDELSERMTKENGGVTPSFEEIFFRGHSKIIKTSKGSQRVWTEPHAEQLLNKYKDAIEAKYPDPAAIPYKDLHVWADVCRDENEKKKLKALVGFSPLMRINPLHGKQFTPGASTSTSQNPETEKIMNMTQKKIDEMEERWKSAFMSAGLQAHLDQLNPDSEADLNEEEQQEQGTHEGMQGWEGAEAWDDEGARGQEQEAAQGWQEQVESAQQRSVADDMFELVRDMDI